VAQNYVGGYTLREISPDDIVSGLSLGDAAFLPLKIYLRRHAKNSHQVNTAKTYVVVPNEHPNRVVAYLTLICSHIVVEATAAEDGHPYNDFPAVKIARLAVDQRHRGKDLGRLLVDWAIAIATEKIMPHVGCRFLTVDSKQQSIKFYEKRGFRLLDTEHNKQQENPVMFIDLAKLK